MGLCVITARFNSKGRKITLVNCYGPTNNSTDVLKQELSDSLQGVLDHTPRCDIRILLRDVNAKIGSDNTVRERIIGHHGLGCTDDNGDRFANLCAFNDQVFGGNIFTHKLKPSIKPHGFLLMVDHLTKLTTLNCH